MKFTDNATVAGTRLTGDGYLVAEVRCARTGCQTYLGSEVGVAEAQTVTVYRPEGVVFHKDSLATFAGKPVTVGHPPEAVTADNWRTYAVGDIGEEIARDGEFIRVPMKLMDADAIRAVQAGTREISMGYTTELAFVDGIAPDGTAYQAVQTGPIRINHLALVPKARGGEHLRVGDAKHGGTDRAIWGASPVHLSDEKEALMADALKTLVLGDKAVQVSASDAAEVEAYKAAQTRALSDAQAVHDAAMATKDAELAAKDAKIADLESKILTDAALDARVQARADLLGKAKALVADLDTAGKSDADIRKAVVLAKRGAAMADKSPAYIDAAFDLLTEDAGAADPVRNALKDSKPILDARTEAENARSEHLKSLRDGWKTPVAAA